MKVEMLDRYNVSPISTVWVVYGSAAAMVASVDFAVVASGTVLAEKHLLHLVETEHCST
jgi:lipid A disaccharide synthetase